jgi:hypothetical protein
MNIDVINVADQVGVARNLLACQSKMQASSLLGCFNTDGIAGTVADISSNATRSYGCYLRVHMSGIATIHMDSAGNGTQTYDRPFALNEIKSGVQIQCTITSGAAPNFTAPFSNGALVTPPAGVDSPIWTVLLGSAANFTYDLYAKTSTSALTKIHSGTVFRGP